MKKYLLPTVALLCSTLSYGQQNNRLSEVASLLFKNAKTTLTTAEKNQIATKLGFVSSGLKDLPFAMDKDSKAYPFNAVVYPTDLNKDGKQEIFVWFGNSYTSGNTGSSISMFIKNAAGTYVDNLGFPGLAPDVLATVNKGYPDLLIGGPGMEFPVLRWNGRTYANFKTVSNDDYDKLKKTSVDSLAIKDR
ncbi:hypothetical protein [Chitinophaga sp. CF418]|uniref:hypothetical protein n=1 Tax=Chitinophaga sp. CF418 TaxID=1855287 RepID=UPI0009174D4D|nr:hypothetical protein [Chitinophaga sp. CF418]SHN10454.1 hypothetical protein SAMN05216311_105174 [Chitinophaga sp. CF418]